MKTLKAVVCSLVVLGSLALAQTPNARIRVMHASPDAPAVDVLVDGSKVLASLPFREFSEYLSLPAKSYDVRVNVAGTSTTVLQANPTLAAGRDYTVIAVGRVSGGDNPLSILLLEDSNAEPVAGQVKFRVVHAAPGAPAVDVYVTTPFEALDAKNPVLSNVPFKVASDYLAVPIQMYQARVAVAGTKTVAIDSHRIATWGGMIRTVVAVDNRGGGAPFDVILLPDRN
ncbi:MAG: DUF4397 domain-containing protein [Bryobacteraceae bacterium]